VLVIHANHTQELSAAVVAACQRLRAAGVTVLSQSVLLRGVNDRVEVLAELSEALIAAGVVPYYLHVLDRVQGAAHFLVPDDEAKAMLRALAARLPGYLVPRLVREEPGATGKTPIPW
jgi:KamA family protein